MDVDEGKLFHHSGNTKIDVTLSSFPFQLKKVKRSSKLREKDPFSPFTAARFFTTGIHTVEPQLEEMPVLVLVKIKNHLDLVERKGGSWIRALVVRGGR